MAYLRGHAFVCLDVSDARAPEAFPGGAKAYLAQSRGAQGTGYVAARLVCLDVRDARAPEAFPGRAHLGREKPVHAR